MNKKQIENQAKELKNKLGGRIFAFPVEPDNPLSKYAFTIYVGKGKFCTYPELANIGEVANYCLEGMKLLNKNGYVTEFERDVRLVTHDAQMNAPDVTMRRLKNDRSNYTKS